MKRFPLRATLLLSLLWGCDKSDKVTGTNDETTTSLATIYRPDGKPAAGARVLVYAAGDTQTAANATGIVDANGQVVLPATPAKGWYNLVVRDGSGRALLEDSILSDGNRLTVFSDTLRRTGKLVGRIRVQPQDKPSIAWAQLLGAGRYVNLDDSGRFTIDSIPSGKYTLAGLTRAALYTPTFRELRIAPDSVVDIGTLDLIYTGVPMVTGVHAVWDSIHSTATVTWDNLSNPDVIGYSVYRGFTNDPETTPPVAYVTGHSIWVDTLFSGRYSSGWNLGGDYDSLQARVFYRVVAKTAQDKGPWSHPDSLDVKSPLLVGAWAPDWKKLKLPVQQSNLVIDSIGTDLATLVPEDSFHVIYTSHDGVTWTKGLKIPGGPMPVFRKGSVWWTTGHFSGLYDTLTGGYAGEMKFYQARIDSATIHRFDGIRQDSVSIALSGGDISRTVLYGAGNGLAMIEERIGINYGSGMTSTYPGAHWASPDGMHWAADLDEAAAWWIRKGVSSPLVSIGSDISLDYAALSPIKPLSSTIQPLLIQPGDQSGTVWIDTGFSKPASSEAPSSADNWPSWTTPAFTAATGSGSTLVFLGPSGIRWSTSDAPDRWKNVAAPAPDLQSVTLWRGQILVHDGTSLWMAPIPVTH